SNCSPRIERPMSATMAVPARRSLSTLRSNANNPPLLPDRVGKGRFSVEPANLQSGLFVIRRKGQVLDLQEGQPLVMAEVQLDVDRNAGNRGRTSAGHRRDTGDELLNERAQLRRVAERPSRPEIDPGVFTVDDAITLRRDSVHGAGHRSEHRGR